MNCRQAREIVELPAWLIWFGWGSRCFSMCLEKMCCRGAAEFWKLTWLVAPKIHPPFTPWGRSLGLLIAPQILAYLELLGILAGKPTLGVIVPTTEISKTLGLDIQGLILSGLCLENCSYHILGLSLDHQQFHSLSLGLETETDF